MNTKRLKEITDSAQIIGDEKLRAIAYESSTSRSSELRAWDVYSCPPMACNYDSRTLAVRSMFKPANYICMSAHDSWSGYTKRQYVSGSVFYNHDIQEEGYYYDFSSFFPYNYNGTNLDWDRLWFFFCTSANYTSRVGYIYIPSGSFYSNQIYWNSTTNIYSDLSNETTGYPSSSYKVASCSWGNRDAYDYPNELGNWTEY